LEALTEPHVLRVEAELRAIDGQVLEAEREQRPRRLRTEPAIANRSVAQGHGRDLGAPLRVHGELGEADELLRLGEREGEARPLIRPPRHPHEVHAQVQIRQPQVLPERRLGEPVAHHLGVGLRERADLETRRLEAHGAARLPGAAHESALPSVAGAFTSVADGWTSGSAASRASTSGARASQLSFSIPYTWTLRSGRPGMISERTSTSRYPKRRSRSRTLRF